MGRKEEIIQVQNLGVKVPSFFRCPISLDVMKSPVSLCTGITYDRSSIRRWLDSGNTTCPATMQPLPSTDLVPNLTLQRLIHFWSASSTPDSPPLLPLHPISDLIRDLRSSSSDPSPSLCRLSDFLLDPDHDDFDKNRLILSSNLATTLAAMVNQNASRMETLEAGFRVLSLILTADFVDESNKKLVVSSLVSNLDSSVSSLIALLKQGKNPDSRIDAARILDAILKSNPDSRIPISEKPDLISELIRLIGSEEEIGKEKMDRSAIEVGLGCLVSISGVRRARVMMVKKGIVAAAKKILMEDASISTAASTDKALKLLEVASGLPEGRYAFCEYAEELVGAILGKMMKVGKKGTEAAIMALWSVCYLFRDQKAVEAVMAEKGGATKILLLMQSDCTPAVRRMCGDLLKVFRVDSKGCLAGYDTKTTHIMPF